MRTTLLTVFLLGATLSHPAERAIEKEILVKAGVDAVWQAWTTKDGVKSFFAPDGEVELRPDGPYEIYFNPYAEPGLKGGDGNRLMAFQEHKMLAFTWNAPPHLPEARKQRTHVVVRFEPQGERQTLVKLRHDGWGDGGEWDKAFDYFSKAWPQVLANLERRFSQGPVDWSEWLKQLPKKPASYFPAQN